MLEELLENLGHDLLGKILLRFSGITIYVPYQVSINHPFYLILNDGEFEQVIEEYGGQTLSFPSARSWMKEVQRKRIHQLKKKKIKNREIALQVGCSERWVREVIRRFPAPG